MKQITIDYQKKIQRGLEAILKIAEGLQDLEKSPFKRAYFERIARISRAQLKNLQRSENQRKA